MTLSSKDKEVDICDAQAGLRNLEANAQGVHVEKLSPGRMNRDLANSQADQEAIPPNGGLEAWLRVLAGHFIYVNTWQALQTKRSRSPKPWRSTPTWSESPVWSLGVSQPPLEYSSSITTAIFSPPKAHRPYPESAAYRPSRSS